LLDPKLYPAQELEKIYFRRWNVELHFGQIKTMLAMDVLRCLTPRMVLKELAMHRIAYNLIRALMQRAASTYDVDLERFPLKALWTASIISQTLSMLLTASLANRPNSSMLSCGRSPPIWSRCAPNEANWPTT
jgi:Transposase DDE domain